MTDQGFVLQQLADTIVGLQNDLWNHKKFRIIDDHFSSDVTNFWPGLTTSGKDDLKTKLMLPLFNAFPDLSWVSLEVISGTSSIATRWTLSGTFQSQYLGYQPNGRKISWQGISIIHVNSGMITSVRTIFDTKPFHEVLEKPKEEKAQSQ